MLAALMLPRVALAQDDAPIPAPAPPALSPDAALAPLVESTEPLPQGSSGLASRYPGDVAISTDPSVLFADDFESAGLDAVLAHWTGTQNAPSIRLDSTSPFSGSRALAMTALRGSSDGAGLTKRLDPGADTVFARFYVRFSDDHSYVERLSQLGAESAGSTWPPEEVIYRPDGEKSFWIAAEPVSRSGNVAPPGEWVLHATWYAMKSYQGKGGRAFYPNTFAPRKEPQALRGAWQCVEIMLKANSKPARRDGQAALWIDGRLVGHWAPQIPKGRWVRDEFVDADYGGLFDGFQWRTRGDLKVNTFSLVYCMARVFEGRSRFPLPEKASANPDRGEVLFDNVVLATSYIGPMAAPPSSAIRCTRGWRKCRKSAVALQAARPAAPTSPSKTPPRDLAGTFSTRKRTMRRGRSNAT